MPGTAVVPPPMRLADLNVRTCAELITTLLPLPHGPNRCEVLAKGSLR
jgi:hypothetical protein